MKVLFLVLGKPMPSTRFRVYQYLPMLKKAGVNYQVVGMHYPVSIRGLGTLFSFWRRLKALFASRHYDLIFLQKADCVIKLNLFLWLLFRRQNKVVFDFDDAIFLNLENGRELSGQFRKRLQFILLHSCLVITGNDYLADFARQYNRNVIIIPTPLDTDKYIPLPAASARNKITIGWMGTKSNLNYLLFLMPVMQELLTDPAINFLIISDLDEKAVVFNHTERMHYKKWQEDCEVSDLQLFDIGLMPLADDPYTRGKCGFKLLQYMAVGIPVVASPVGMNCQIVEVGINGFLANSEKEWLDNLRTLCADEKLRHRMGIAGRESIKKKYSLQKFSGQWVSMLKREAAGK